MWSPYVYTQSSPVPAIIFVFFFLRLFRFLLELFDSLLLPGLSVGSGGPSRFNNGIPSGLALSGMSMESAWVRLESADILPSGTGTC